MSVCEIEYKESEQHFFVRFYLFQDDLKEAVYGDPLDGRLEAEKISTYILKNTDLIASGHNIALNFKELKERKDQVLVSYISEKILINDYSHLTISNEIMIEKFRTQTNMVYVTLPNRSKWTQIFNANKTKAEYHF